MNCPFCAHPDTKVTDSRPDQGGIRRRRECLSESGGCGMRFSTIERVELAGVSLVKKDGELEEFDREKIIKGVRKACEKRPIPSGAIEALADAVQKEIYAQGKAEVPSSFVGELVMERLRGLDHIAYIRFASVYRAFADVDELADELAALKAGWTRPNVPPDQLALIPDVAPGAAPAKPKRRRRKRSESDAVVPFPENRASEQQRKAEGR
jgi:transcriptional repressor NrdR